MGRTLDATAVSAAAKLSIEGATSQGGNDFKRKLLPRPLRATRARKRLLSRRWSGRRQSELFFRDMRIFRRWEKMLCPCSRRASRGSRNRFRRRGRECLQCSRDVQRVVRVDFSAPGTGERLAGRGRRPIVSSSCRGHGSGARPARRLRADPRLAGPRRMGCCVRPCTADTGRSRPHLTERFT